MRDRNREEIQFSTFGELLKAFRKQRQMTQQELAIRIGAHRNTIGIWERGDCLPESKTIVLELAHQLCLDTHDIRCLLEASLTALSPYWQVPYQRNPFFTGREEVLQQLHDTLAYEHTATLSQSYSLSGLGGIGKTQAAIEYAYRYANGYSAVLWISAETYENIVSSMITIATLLNLPEKQEKDQEKVVVAITRWLSNHRDWLLILDNIEDPALIKRFLPPARNGSLLLTSRRQALGLTAQTLNLERMMPEEGMHFLLHRARLLNPMVSPDALPPIEKAFALEIVAAMDGLPLALDQAGAYIEATQCSLYDYLQLFQSSQLQLLDERDAHADHPSSVTRTFALAFEQLERNNPAAAELLIVCAFLASEAIPDAFFIEGATHLGPTFEMLAADPLQFQNALKALLTYSLLQRNTSAHTVTIHHLVQIVLKERLSETVQRVWVARILRTMSFLFPAENMQVDYWQMCEALLPHALMCIMLSDQWREDEALSIALMSHVATYLLDRARFAGAKALYEQALHLGELVLDLEHPLIAEVLHGLANVYQAQGKYEQAEPLYQRALSIRKQAMGSEHFLVSATLGRLASLYYEQGKYEQAELFYQQALSILEHTVHPIRPLPALLNNLGNLYAEQGKYEQAELFYQRAMRTWEQIVKPECPQVAQLMGNLALLYHEQGKYEQAELFYQRAISIFEQELDSDHPHITYPLTNLGDLYREQGKYEQAEPLYRRALHIREHTLGPDHPNVADPLTGLAALLSDQGKYEEAEPLYQRALALRQEHLGPQHPLFAETLHHLAHFHHLQHHTTEALSLYQQTLAIYEQVFGTEHLKTRKTQNEYICILDEVARKKEINSDIIPSI